MAISTPSPVYSRPTHQGRSWLLQAGISLASGIPTFRGQDPGAIWKKDVMELGTFRYFRQDPVGSWRWRRSSPPPGPWLRAPPARDLRKHRQPLRGAVRGGSNRLRTWCPQFRCKCRAATRPRRAEYVTGTQLALGLRSPASWRPFCKSAYPRRWCDSPQNADNGSSVNHMHLRTQSIHMAGCRGSVVAPGCRPRWSVMPFRLRGELRSLTSNVGHRTMTIWQKI